MVEVLSEEAARLFRFKEQEQLHEEIIDTGLARLYQAHLEVAQRLAQARGVSLTTTLLTGRAADEVLAYAQRTRPWLLLLGRIGVHSREEMDIGGVTEHLLRFAPCNLLVASRRLSPPLDLWSASTLRWTEEAEAALNHTPAEYRGALRLLVQHQAQEQGHTVVTASLVGEAMVVLRPRPEETRLMGEAALSVALGTLRTQPGMVYLCRGCGHAVRGQRPMACPVCQKKGEDFLEVDPQTLEATAQGQGGVEEKQAFDGTALRWARAALEQLRHIPDPYQRSRARLRVEKEARYRKIPVITLEFALRHLPETLGAQGQAEHPSGAEQAGP